MGKFYVVLGKSATGKTTLEKILYTILMCDNMPVKKVVSATSRPPRTGENHGVDYFFLSKEEFETRINQEDFCEYTSFNGWYYGTPIKENDLNLEENSYIAVMNPSGLNQLKKKYGSDKIISLYLECKDEVRIKRSMEREDNPNHEEIARRCEADNLDFKGIESEVSYIFDTTDVHFLDLLTQVYHTVF